MENGEAGFGRIGQGGGDRRRRSHIPLRCRWSYSTATARRASGEATAAGRLFSLLCRPVDLRLGAAILVRALRNPALAAESFVSRDEPS